MTEGKLRRSWREHSRKSRAEAQEVVVGVADEVQVGDEGRLQWPSVLELVLGPLMAALVRSSHCRAAMQVQNTVLLLALCLIISSEQSCWFECQLSQQLVVPTFWYASCPDGCFCC